MECEVNDKTARKNERLCTVIRLNHELYGLVDLSF